MDFVFESKEENGSQLTAAFTITNEESVHYGTSKVIQNSKIFSTNQKLFGKTDGTCKDRISKLEEKGDE